MYCREDYGAIAGCVVNDPVLISLAHKNERWEREEKLIEQEGTAMKKIRCPQCENDDAEHLMIDNDELTCVICGCIFVADW